MSDWAELIGLAGFTGTATGASVSSSPPHAPRFSCRTSSSRRRNGLLHLLHASVGGSSVHVSLSAAGGAARTTLAMPGHVVHALVLLAADVARNDADQVLGRVAPRCRRRRSAGWQRRRNARWRDRDGSGQVQTRHRKRRRGVRRGHHVWRLGVHRDDRDANFEARRGGVALATSSGAFERTRITLGMHV